MANRSEDKMDLVGKIIAYEGGEMDADQEYEFLEGLVQTGMIHKLQGSYGRAAARLGLL